MYWYYKWCLDKGHYTERHTIPVGIRNWLHHIGSIDMICQENVLWIGKVQLTLYLTSINYIYILGNKSKTKVVAPKDLWPLTAAFTKQWQFLLPPEVSRASCRCHDSTSSCLSFGDRSDVFIYPMSPTWLCGNLWSLDRCVWPASRRCLLPFLWMVTPTPFWFKHQANLASAFLFFCNNTTKNAVFSSTCCVCR